MKNSILGLYEKKKIFINGRFLTQPTTGVQRFARELMNAIDENIYSREQQFICMVPNDAQNGELPNWKNIQIAQVGKLKGNAWEQIELPVLARNGLLLNLCNIGPLLHFNQMIVFHDASVFAIPEAYSFFFKAKYKFIMSILSHTAKQIITVSHFSKKELSRFLHVEERKIKVIHEGCEHIQKFEPDFSIIEEKGLIEKPFFLTVGSSSTHKNLQAVVKAMRLNPDNSVYLVVAGGSYSKVFIGSRRFEDQNICQLGYVSDGQLRALYQNATCFIFPSLYEGFGLPPLEAMSCGCPVLCSNRASLPEVCGDAAIYFDPLNIIELRAQIIRLKDDSGLQSSLRINGLERVKQFTWENAARSFLDIILLCERD